MSDARKLLLVIVLAYIFIFVWGHHHLYVLTQLGQWQLDLQHSKGYYLYTAVGHTRSELSFPGLSVSIPL